MISSMTRYGTGSFSWKNCKISVEVKSLNHRFLDVRCRFPQSLQDYCFSVEKIVRTELKRGKIEIAARIEMDTQAEATIDQSKAIDFMLQIKKIRDEISPQDPLPFSLLGNFSHLLTSQNFPEPEKLEKGLHQATQQACLSANTMGAFEGRVLCDDFITRLNKIEKLVENLSKLQPEILQKQIQKTKNRLATLLDEQLIKVNPERLEQEIVLLGDKIDITEELVRLGSHRNQFLSFIDSDSGKKTPTLGSEPIGKKLDFLLQEMNREANTICSKTTESDSKWISIELKSEIEKMREQVQNVL